MGIELYPQSTSLVFWRRCRPLQFQMEPSGVKFVVPLGTYSFARLPATRSWRRGSHSNPFPVLRARNLLILRVALVAGTALTAVVGYSFGTDASHDPFLEWGPLQF